MRATRDEHRIVVTGMSIATPLGDELDATLTALMRGTSAISAWRSIDSAPIYSKVGGDMGTYDARAALGRVAPRLRPERAAAIDRLIARAPWSTGISVVLALRALLDAALLDEGAPWDPERTSVLLAGHNINLRYDFDNRTRFDDEPDFIDGMFVLNNLDSDHAGCVSEAIGALGGAATYGAACASGNLALKHAIDDIRYHGVTRAMVVGAVLDYSPMSLHAMALMGAISMKSFNDAPTQASRPFDVRREGFVPSHGGAALVLESLATARARGAPIHAELVGAEASSDGSHLPHPSQDGQVRAVRRLLEQTGVSADEIDYVNAHATSTPLGDVTEARSLRHVLGARASEVWVNAPKSLLGHTCWSAALVETVCAILQMKAGQLHACANLVEVDPEVELRLVREPVRCTPRYVLKNSFGFGGMNCVTLLRRWDGA